MEEMNYQPSLPRVIQLLSEKIARLEQENALIISQNETLIALIQTQEQKLAEAITALSVKEAAKQEE